MRDLIIKFRGAACITTLIDSQDKDRVNKRLNVDQFGTAKQLLNPCGFPQNDIMAFENAQSESVARTILQRISVNKDTGVPNDGRTIEEHFADLCPSSWSSPAEYIRYQKKVAENAYKRIESKRAAAEAAKRLAAEQAIRDAQTINVNPE